MVVVCCLSPILPRAFGHFLGAHVPAQQTNIEATKITKPNLTKPIQDQKADEITV